MSEELEQPIAAEGIAETAEAPAEATPEAEAETTEPATMPTEPELGTV